MDLKKFLNKGQTKAKTLQIVDYVGVNRSRFKQLVNIYQEGPYRITQRAAWPLSYCVQRHPELITTHLNQILDFLNKPNTHDAVRRNTFRLLQYIKIPPRLHAKVINLGFYHLTDKSQAVAIRVFAMSVLANLTEAVPEIKNELKGAIEEQLPLASAAFVSRARKVLKKLR